MSKKIFQTILVLLFAITSGCIHTPSQIKQPIELEQSSPLKQILRPDLKIESLIYSADRLPLERFFSELAAGEYTRAFKEIDFQYYPSNTNSEVIKELFKEGLVPAYVRVKNVGKNEFKVSRKNFFFKVGQQTISSLSTEEIPHTFERINPTAIVANMYNLSVVVLGSAAVLAGSYVSQSGSVVPPNLIFTSDRPIFNKVRKTTQIDYKDYLFSEKLLKPNETFEGILFFNQKLSASDGLYELVYIE